MRTTSSPVSLSTAQCTCATDADASGVGSTLEKTLESGLPSSSSMTPRTLAHGVGGVSSRHFCISVTNAAGKRVGDDAMNWPSLTYVAPMLSKKTRSATARASSERPAGRSPERSASSTACDSPPRSPRTVRVRPERAVAPDRRPCSVRVAAVVGPTSRVSLSPSRASSRSSVTLNGSWPPSVGARVPLLLLVEAARRTRRRGDGACWGAKANAVEAARRPVATRRGRMLVPGRCGWLERAVSGVERRDELVVVARTGAGVTTVLPARCGRSEREC